MKIAVRDWMTPDPVSIEPEASVLAAIELMVNGGLRHLPVVDAARAVVGILTLNDLRSTFDEPLNLRRLPSAESLGLARDYRVAELMTHAPSTITADASLEGAASCMAARRIGCLPVLDAQGLLIGLLSETDALRALVALLALDRRTGSPETLARSDTIERRLRGERWRILNRLARLADAQRELAGEQRVQTMDAAERGSDLQAVELDEGLAGLSVRRLAALDRALDRAAQGRLGICDGCGASIPTARLQALPGTSLCVRCARAREEGGEPGPLRAEPLAGFGAKIGGLVYTPQGEGRLQRIAPFGTCGSCGEVEGSYDEDEDAMLCTSPGCGIQLTDVVELAVVEVADEVISVAPEKLGRVDPRPYD